MQNPIRQILFFLSVTISLDAFADVKCWVIGYEKNQDSISELIQATSEQDAIKFFKKKYPTLRKIKIDGKCNTNIPEMWVLNNMPDSARTPNSLKNNSDNANVNASTKNEESQVSDKKNENFDESNLSDFEKMLLNSLKGVNIEKFDMRDANSNNIMGKLSEAAKETDKLCNNVLGAREREQLIAKNKSRAWRVQAVGVGSNVVTGVRHSGFDECTGAAKFNVEYRSKGTSGSGTINCGFGAANSISSTAFKAQCY
jgi:hypothetical protein